MNTSLHIILLIRRYQSKESLILVQLIYHSALCGTGDRFETGPPPAIQLVSPVRCCSLSSSLSSPQPGARTQ